jgi:enterochelin esterase-like enzyme
MKIKEVQSPYIYEIFNEMKCNHIKSCGTPIIESVADGVCIHFIYFGDSQTKTVHVLGSFPGWELQKGEMTKIEGNQIWVKSFKTDRPLASSYYFSVNDDYGDNWGERFKHFISDPQNPNKMLFSESPGDNKKENTELSYVSVNEPLLSMDISSKNPNISKENFKSKVLNNERNLWIYDPIKNTDTPKNLLIVFDGFQYTEAIPVANMIDHLYEEGKIPPTVMIGVDSLDRFNEFNGNEQFANFIAVELLPWIRNNFAVSHNPNNIALCGASLGGLTAFYTALNHSNLFGNVISQSGSFNHKKTKVDDEQYWSVHYLETQPKLPVRIYMNSGRLEMDELQKANSLTHQTLTNNGYDVKYELFNGGHDLLWWRESFLDGLEYIFCID